MSLLVLLCGTLVFAYALLMVLYRLGWQREPFFHPPAGFQPQTGISIIIPARNEAANIRRCVQSILEGQYPAQLVEVLVVDDHSTDDTAGIVRSMEAPNVRVLRLADYIDPDAGQVAYKKKALGMGIANSTGELIVTTDADCEAPATWLLQLAALYELRQPAMIIAPVDFTCDSSLVQQFQSIDFMTMQGITAASHRLGMGNMANGANLAFSRKAFEVIGGYAGTEHLASGDDFLLLVKMRRMFPDDVHFLKTPAAIMSTAPQPDWRGFLRQRVRWASKSGRYGDHRITAILLLVYLVNLSFLPALIAALYRPGYWWLPAGMLVVKVVCELLFLVPVAAFFRKQRQLWLFPLLQPLHIAYIIMAGFLGRLGQYEWKGRQVYRAKPEA